MNTQNSIERLQSQIDYKFANPALLELALTHRSFASQNNERLEFLGDSIVNFVVAAELYLRYPKFSEGKLTRMRSQLVCGEMLAEVAKENNLGDFLQFGTGEKKSGGHQRRSILADTVEAIIGAVYLDAELETVRKIILRWLAEKFEIVAAKKTVKDPKTRLQELMQSKKLPLPDYTIIKIEGKQHDQIFHVECKIEELDQTTVGVGDTRRQAEKIAAEELLKILEQK